MELKPLDQINIPRGKLPSAGEQQGASTRANTMTNSANDAVVQKLNLTRGKNQAFESRNTLISLSNIAKDGIQAAANELAKLTPGVDAGPVKSKLAEIAKRQAPNGQRPLSGDALLLPSSSADRYEQFPDDLVTGFGLSQEKEPSEETIAEVRARLEEFRSRSEEVLRSIRDSISTLDVAGENSDAAAVSVRDLEAAANLAENTKLSISSKSANALESNSLSPDALLLLE